MQQSFLSTGAGDRYAPVLYFSCFPCQPGRQDDPGYRPVPGDLIGIKVYDHDDLARDIRIPQDGAIAFPLWRLTKLTGMSELALRQLLQTQLEAKYLQSRHQQQHLNMAHAWPTSWAASKSRRHRIITVLQHLGHAGNRRRRRL